MSKATLERYSSEFKSRVALKVIRGAKTLAELADGRAYGSYGAFLLKSPGKPRVDNRRAFSGIILVNRNVLRWREASWKHEFPRTLYDCRKRWGGLPGFFCPHDERPGYWQVGPSDDHDRGNLSEGAPHSRQPAG